MPPKDANRRKQEIAAKVQEIKCKQQKWMDEKKQSTQGNRYNGSSIERGQSTTSSKQSSRSDTADQLMDLSLESNNVEKWLQQNSATCSTPQQRAPTYQPGNYETPQSAEDFGSIADRIIDRVKNNLGVNQGSDNDFPSTYGADADSSTHHQPLSSHLCYKCNKLMVGPHHSPIMLIPCGHSLCEACCRDAVSCYSCGSEVSGHTPNVMLQQIILTKSTPGKSRVRRDKRVGSHKDTDEETLILRREAMQEEILNIEQTITEINAKIQDEVEQISSIERKEAGIIGEISNLQTRLVRLQQHKREFKEKITAHRSDIAAEQKKIDLVNETIKYLASRLTSHNS